MLMSRHRILAPCVVCLCALSIGWIQSPRLQNLLKNQQDISLASLEKDIQAESLRLNLLKKTPSFGYDNLMANWVYLNFLQYFGDEEIRAKTGYGLSPEYFEVIIERDPRFLEVYISLSTSISLYAAMPERSIVLMDKALKSLKPKVPEKSYYVWRYKGIDELLFLGNYQAAQQSFTTAANWATNYTDEESKYVAVTSLRTANFLRQNPDSKYAQISTWAMILSNQVDEITQKRAINEIEKLGGRIVTTPEGVNQIIFPPQD
ncbi:hypothetical protein [Anabaena subtropica]|uniref:Uncharacterized protein n=1 Tax=Anabaena subtropica FACHB-260 TaxID=2692884 RepID=A0ABR8CKK8_9NOST|nr:hypothetical protein [Anabaena subtropica]MBD2342933.1 hypothetical protein [Anabaena subtropica FACHB-260]